MTDYSAQAHFGDYDPTTFGWPHATPDLVPLSFDGVSFGSCARDAHPVFIALLTELVPLIPGGLHAGSCGAYSTTDDLAGGVWSFHHYGIAIDVNWNVNKMGVPNPATGEYAIPHAQASAIAHKYGCEYGGDWSSPKDWMHFEVHLSPAVAQTVQVLDPTDELMGELMAFYGSQAAFEAAMRNLVHQEIGKYMALYNPANKTWDGGMHAVQTVIARELALYGFSPKAGASAVTPEAVVAAPEQPA